jgi:S1-C subfamily serine protease
MKWTIRIVAAIGIVYISSYGYCGDLHEIFSNEQYSLYFNPSLTFSQGDSIKTVLVWSYKTQQTEGENSFVTSVESVIISCKYKSLTVIDYTLVDKSGSSVFSKKLNKVTTGSVAGKIVDFICKYQMNQNGSKTPAKPAAQQGSGFFINGAGDVLTCYHVIEGKAKVTAYSNEAQLPLTLVRADKKNDLAVLRSNSGNHTYITFKKGKSFLPGEHCIALGYPLQGILSQEVNITSGQVSAMSGPDNDIRLLQVTAPIQQGNSGGPLLNDRGQICGLVMSKLNAIKLADATGDIPENIGFALNAQMIKIFLDAYGVNYDESDSEVVIPDPDIANKFRSAVLLIVAE